MIRIALIAAIVLPVLAQAQEAKVPWTERIDLFGDVRLRHDYTSKTKATDTSDSHQERLRLRAGLNAKINDKIKTKIRLATAQGQNPISTNQTLTENANKKGFYVDITQVDYTIADGQVLSLGKIENPLRILAPSQLMFDVDYTPEGAAYAGQFGGLFVRAAGYSIQERAQQTDGTSEPDSWLMSGMVGYKSDLTEKMSYTIAAGYHDFTSLKNNAALSSFAGNSSFGTGGGARYAHDYKVGEALAELRMKGEKCVTTVYVDFLNNFATEKDNRAYLAGASLQTMDENGKTVWNFGYAYESINKDATVSAINNSDFANGNDGAFGHIFQVGRTLSPNTMLNLTWNNSHIDNNGNPFTSDRAFLDFVVAF